MKVEEVIKICKDRNELKFLFAITKQIAEADSIGEGWGYCDKYEESQFNNAEKHTQNNRIGTKGEYCKWLVQGGVPIYELYLSQIIALVCVHPFASVMSKCNGEINKCLKCGESF